MQDYYQHIILFLKECFVGLLFLHFSTYQYLLTNFGIQSQYFLILLSILQLVPGLWIKDKRGRVKQLSKLVRESFFGLAFSIINFCNMSILRRYIYAAFII